MSGYSIDYGYESINHIKTKEYFGEVMQSYVSGSYRSAVVMLYSVVVSDLIYKLKDLKDLYEDKVAVDILNKVEGRQKANPKSSEWEILLIDEISKRTYLLESLDKVNLEHLRSHRHLSAHPVLNGEDLLSTPSRETVRALMRNMLEGILTKSAVMSTKVFTVLLEDLAKNEDNFIDTKSLEKYLESRYFKNVNDRIIEEIFRSLWRFTFELQNDDCKKHRHINYLALKVIYSKYSNVLRKYIKSQEDYFSQKFELSDEKSMEFLFLMLGSFPEIYQLLSQHAKGLIENFSKSNWKFRVNSRFLVETTKDHFELLIKELYAVTNRDYNISDNQINLLTKWAREEEEEEECMNLLNHLLIEYFIYSSNYDSASSNFKKYIEPYLSNFSEGNLRDLLEGINKNSQCYEHRLAARHNTVIKGYSDKLFEVDFNYEQEFPKVTFL